MYIQSLPEALIKHQHLVTISKQASARCCIQYGLQSKTMRTQRPVLRCDLGLSNCNKGASETLTRAVSTSSSESIVPFCLKWIAF